MAMYRVQEDIPGKKSWWLKRKDGFWDYGTVAQAKDAWWAAAPEVRDAHPNVYILGPSGGRYSVDTGRSFPARYWEGR